MSLAQVLRRILSSRAIKESLHASNLDATLEEFRTLEEVPPNQQEKNPSPPVLQQRSVRVMRLEAQKKELLGKITRVQEQLFRQE